MNKIIKYIIIVLTIVVLSVSCYNFEKEYIPLKTTPEMMIYFQRLEENPEGVEMYAFVNPDIVGFYVIEPLELKTDKYDKVGMSFHHHEDYISYIREFLNIEIPEYDEQILIFVDRFEKLRSGMIIPKTTADFTQLDTSIRHSVFQIYKLEDGLIKKD